MELPGQHESPSASGPEPHCAYHSHFVDSCPVCKQARANMLPYPIKKSEPPSRSFGMTGNITSATFFDPTYPRYGNNPVDLNGLNVETELEASLGLTVIRFILRIIWPFSRIL